MIAGNCVVLNIGQILFKCRQFLLVLEIALYSPGDYRNKKAENEYGPNKSLRDT